VVRERVLPPPPPPDGSRRSGDETLEQTGMLKECVRLQIALDAD